MCPQNILVGYDGTAYITDFGVAKAVGQLAQTLAGVHKGKIAYMSPEQVRGDPLDRRSDVFSLGITLWEATLSKRLFKDVNEVRSAARVLKGRVPRPSSFVPDYPPDLERVILKALCRKPEDRYATARLLADDLRTWLSTVGVPGPAELAELMDTLCHDRHERKQAIESRARTESLSDGPIMSSQDQEAFASEESLPFAAASDVDLEDLDVEMGLGDAGLADDDGNDPRPPDTQILAFPPSATKPTSKPIDFSAAELPSVLPPEPRQRRSLWVGAGVLLVAAGLGLFAWGSFGPEAEPPVLNTPTALSEAPDSPAAGSLGTVADEADAPSRARPADRGTPAQEVSKAPAPKESVTKKGLRIDRFAPRSGGTAAQAPRAQGGTAP